MKSMKASDFKARCLQVMDEVAATGEPVVVTKNGHPVSQMVAHRLKLDTLFGAFAGALEVTGDLIEPVDVEWEASA